MLTLLGFGSSARRGAAGWTDRARIRGVIDTVRPDVVVEGASPAKGADDIIHGEAVAAGILTAACHVDHALDGPWPAAGHRRNARMYRTHRPSLAAGFVSGKVGDELSAGSKGMARICLYGLDDVPPCPVVVYREDGVEPHATLSAAIAQLHRLHEVTGDERLTAPGLALDAFWRRECSTAEVLAALAFARDGSRWAPWIEAVETTVRLVF